MSNKKKLMLVGYGKMGRLIEQFAPQHGFEVVLRLDSKSNPEGRGITTESGADVAIEFTSPHAAPANLIRLARARIPAVAGTTGWLHDLERISQVVRENGTSLLWSPNFSVGIAVFRKLAGVAAELLKIRESTAHGLGKFTTTQKRMRRREPCLIWCEPCNTAGTPATST